MIGDMQIRKLVLWLFVVSLAVFGVGYTLTNSVVFGVCDENSLVCRGLLNKIGDPLYYGFGALSIVFLILLAFPSAFGAWKKFAIWFVPLAALLFIIWPEPRGGLGVIPSVIGPPPEQVFQWISGAYVLASAVIIGWKTFRLRNKG